MTVPRSAICLAAVLIAFACWSCGRAPSASAGVTSKACGAAGDANKVAGGVCDVLSNPGKALNVGKNLVTGHVGSAVKSLIGGSASTASTALGLTAIVAWVAGGARFSLDETTKVLGSSTTPQLHTTWFSAKYWRIAGIAALLTLPFLFAAAVQALIHADMTPLTRAALGYLPLAMLAIAIAAPITMLLLAATDQLSASLSSAAGGIHPSWTRAGVGAGLGAEAFLRFLIALVTTACAVVLWLELAIREAAVYVIVLMLPLAFAALVWPARRVWAIRAVELLVALIISKLAIVAVFDLGGAALDQLGHGSTGALTAGLAGTVLVLLAALSPWAVLRLVPMSELASSAVGSLRGEASSAFARRRGPDGYPYERADDAPESARGTAADASRGAEAEIERMTALSGALNGSRRDARAKSVHGEPAPLAADVPLEGEPGDEDGAKVAEGERDGSGTALGGDGPAPAGGDGGAVFVGGAVNSPNDDASRADTTASTEDGFKDWPAMFHAPNFSWKPIPLGSDADLNNLELWPPDGRTTDGQEAQLDDEGRLPSPQDDGAL